MTTPDLDLTSINLDLTDADRQMIADAARPLPPRDRTAFIRDVLTALQGRGTRSWRGASDLREPAAPVLRPALRG
jgi:hypothetical protein